MASLATCSSCNGFVLETADRCVHCDAALSEREAARTGGRLWKLIGGAAVSVTLMACYGAYPQHATAPRSADYDGDGYAEPYDCDDRNRDVYPGGPEIDGDGIDSDCSGGDGTGPAAQPNESTLAAPPPEDNESTLAEPPAEDDAATPAEPAEESE